MSFNNFLQFLTSLDDPAGYCIKRYHESKKSKKFWRKMAVQMGADDDRNHWDVSPL